MAQVVSKAVALFKRCYECCWSWMTVVCGPVRVLKVSTSTVKTNRARAGAPLVYVKVRNGKQGLVAMIDTGSEINIVGRELLNRLECQKIVARPIRLHGCGGMSLATERVKVPLEFVNGWKVEIEAAVGEEFGSALILGSAFLHENEIGLEYKGLFMKTHLGPLPCVLVPDLMTSNKVRVGVLTTQAMREEDEKVLKKIVFEAQIREEEKVQLEALLLEFGDLWVGNPRGQTKVLRHKVTLLTEKPVREKPRRFTPEQLKVIDTEVKQMLQDKVIRPSSSPYAQEPHLIKKKTGDWRFCIDYRKLNAVTQADEWPLPRIQDLIRSIRTSTHFVGLDLRSGYWQIMMDEDSIPCTAFRTRSGLYEFLVMPFGLKTAPATFTRLMDKVVGDLFWQGVCVYLDDVLIHSESFPKTLRLLRQVLSRLRDAKLTLAMNKCLFFPKHLLYLGFIVEDGVLKPNPAKVDALRKIRTPTNAREVRSLLGCLGYFRQFIPHFSDIAEPINKLLRKRTIFQWTVECEEAKEKLIGLLIETTLSNPLEGDLLKLETDASDTAIGAALFCRASQEDPWRPVEFLSKSLTPTERNWPVHEREAFAIVYSLRKLEAYIRGRALEVYTDNASLQWMQTTKAGKVARWAAILGEFNIRIIYRPGKTNVCADFLSRFIENEGDDLVPERAFVHPVTTTLPEIELIIEAQRIQPPPKARGYFEKDGVIYHQSKIWVPPARRLELIERYHNVALFHHPGVRRMVTAIRKVFSWSGLYVDVLKYNKACLGCQRLRPGTEALQGFVTQHPVGSPFSRVYADIYVVNIEGVDVSILSVIDNHTKWVESRVLSDRSAATIASVFVQEWVCRFGCPAEIVMDNEKGFISSFMQQVCQLLGMTRLLTTVKHPDANAPVESFHRVLTKGFQRYLLTESRKLPIEETLQLILLGYRASLHSTTKETPAYLTLGMDPCLAPDMFGRRCEPENQKRIDILNEIREDVIQKAYLRGIQQFARNQQYRRTTPLEVGELVLLPIDRSEASYHAIRKSGRKVQPKYTMPYRVTKVFNQGRSAKCRSLCPLAKTSHLLREASIQDIRRISLPLTNVQKIEWNKVLDGYFSEHVLDEELREKLCEEFWEKVMDEPETQERTKRPRQDLEGRTVRFES